jgi:hypothetical protein
MDAARDAVNRPFVAVYSTMQAFRLQYRLRTLLLLTALVAVVLAGYVRQRRLEGMARMHLRQAELVAEHRQWLYSVSFMVPQVEWAKIDERERLHRQIAGEYRQQIWRPWVRISQPDPPLAIQIEGDRGQLTGDRGER